MEMVRSALQHAWMPPKNVEPVTASWPDGASPVTAMDAGLAGSLLVMVTLAEAGPTLVGAKRIGSGTDSPGPMDIGYEMTCGTWKSADELVMPVIERTQAPLLFRIRGSSANEPTQAVPMFPLSAMARTSRGVGATPDTETVRGPSRSLLNNVSVALAPPTLEGWKRITISMVSPGPIARGYEATDGTTKSGDDDVMSEIRSRLNPVLLMVRISSVKEFRQTFPKSPEFAMAVTMMGAGASAARS